MAGRGQEEGFEITGDLTSNFISPYTERSAETTGRTEKSRKVPGSVKTPTANRETILLQCKVKLQCKCRGSSYVINPLYS